MILSIVYTAIGVAAGWLLLTMFYASVRTQWPSNYASSSNDYGMIVNRTIFHYVIFSVVPAYVVALIVSTTVTRGGGHGLTCGLLIGAAHTFQRYGLHLYKTLRFDRSAQRFPTAILDMAVIVAVLMSASIGGLGPPPHLSYVVPPVDEFFNSLWGTTFVAVLAALILARTRVVPDMTRLLRRSRSELGPDLITLMRHVAVAHGCDSDLAESILLTENLERPRWFRALERLKGRYFPHGSYGVMQVLSDAPVSDEESIVIAARDHLAGLRVKRTVEGYPDYETLQASLRSYNPNPNFIDVATNIFFQISAERSVALVATAQAVTPVEQHFPSLGGDGAPIDNNQADILVSANVKLCGMVMMSLADHDEASLTDLNLALKEFLRRR